MRQSFYLLLITASIIACNNATDHSVKEADSNTVKSPGREKNESSNSQPAPESQSTSCYMRVLQRDTLVAHLNQTGNNISGQLTFDNFEKDSNMGTVTGTVESEIINLVYTFQSEGTTSKREIRFKKTDDGITLANGKMEEKNGIIVFTNPASINYPNSEKLMKVDCDNVPARYK